MCGHCSQIKRKAVQRVIDPTRKSRLPKFFRTMPVFSDLSLAKNKSVPFSWSFPNIFCCPRFSHGRRICKLLGIGGSCRHFIQKCLDLTFLNSENWICSSYNFFISNVLQKLSGIFFHLFSELLPKSLRFFPVIFVVVGWRIFLYCTYFDVQFHSHSVFFETSQLKSFLSFCYLLQNENYHIW